MSPLSRAATFPSNVFVALSVLPASSNILAPVAAEKVWGAVAFVVHGEFTPSLLSSPQTLTPLGANQAYEAGSLLRYRLVENASISEDTGAVTYVTTNLTSPAPIEGLSSSALDNSVINILSTNDEYVSTSATAFLQGLYPPVGTTSGQDATTLANGSRMYFPLSDYQYPNIQTLSGNDYNSIWIEGTENCLEQYISELDYLSSDTYFATINSSYDFYQSLSPTVFPEDVISPALVDYQKALDLYQYANYQSVHNGTIAVTLSSADLQQLRVLANQDQWQRYANLSASGLKSGDEIRAIAGKTLAARIYSSLWENVILEGEGNKLSLLFGSWDPLLSFFALSQLSSEAGSSDDWQGMPDYGSMALFELFSNDDASTNGSYPDTEDLWVRFLFRNGTGENAVLRSYPLFARGNSASDMVWSDFVSLFEDIMISDASTWCNVCDSVSVFCAAFDTNTDGSDSSSNSGCGLASGSSAVSPAVGGIIGAAVTIAVMMLAGAAAMLFGGVRIHRKNGSHSGSGPRGSTGTLGGFKGAEKLASDLDVSDKSLKTGAAAAGMAPIRHERLGSWELNDRSTRPEERLSGATQVGPGERVAQNLDEAVVRSRADYSKDDDDAISIVNPFGDPVKVDDRV